MSLDTASTSQIATSQVYLKCGCLWAQCTCVLTRCYAPLAIKLPPPLWGKVTVKVYPSPCTQLWLVLTSMVVLPLHCYLCLLVHVSLAACYVWYSTMCYATALRTIINYTYGRSVSVSQKCNTCSYSPSPPPPPFPGNKYAMWPGLWACIYLYIIIL